MSTRCGASEEVLGNTLRACGVKRESVVIATKVFNPMSEDVNDRGLSRKHILDSIDRSLRRLKMEYVDLYQIHRWDYATPIEETMEALNDVVKSGKARYIGASSMFAWQFAKAQYTADLHGWRRFVSMQNHYNLVYREEEREMIPLCIDQGIGLIPWSPMARGFFGGNRHKQGGGETVRAQTDDFAGMLVLPPGGFHRCRTRLGSCQSAQRDRFTDRAGLDPEQALRYCTHHRRKQAGASRPVHCRAGNQPFARGNQDISRNYTSRIPCWDIRRNGGFFHAVETALANLLAFHQSCHVLVGRRTGFPGAHAA